MPGANPNPNNEQDEVTLGMLIDKAYGQIQDLLDDPKTGLKDRIALYRILAYYKGTSSKGTGDSTPATAEEARKMLKQVRSA